MTDNIKVIASSTQERKEEIKELFDKIRPLLDEGHVYSTAIREVTGKQNFNRFRYGWCRDLLEYGESQGYPYIEYSGRHNMKYKKKD